MECGPLKGIQRCHTAPKNGPAAVVAAAVAAVVVVADTSAVARECPTAAVAAPREPADASPTAYDKTARRIWLESGQWRRRSCNEAE